MSMQSIKQATILATILAVTVAPRLAAQPIVASALPAIPALPALRAQTVTADPLPSSCARFGAAVCCATFQQSFADNFRLQRSAFSS